MSEALHRATHAITARDLPHMVLSRTELPPSLHHFLPVRDGILDNDTMARQGFPGSSAERFRAVGRLTGYLQEFAAPTPETEPMPPGYDLAVATVVHLFEDTQGVSRWIEEIFLREFEVHVDQELQDGQRLLMVQRLQFHGFADEVAGLRVLQSSPIGPISSTVVDFRLGRLLGVAYVATLGNYARGELVERLGLALERKIVRVVLEVPTR
ncbi:MAG TPA: hypothetical protein VIH59_03735 [Candidatus Tectomicrobia bacterium]